MASGISQGQTSQGSISYILLLLKKRKEEKRRHTAEIDPVKLSTTSRVLVP
jgi:hypothetical protein